jgi:hypothetical protein
MDATQKLQAAEEFLQRLINPGVYGLTITDEVRKEAVRVLRIVEQSK